MPAALKTSASITTRAELSDALWAGRTDFAGVIMAENMDAECLDFPDGTNLSNATMIGCSLRGSTLTNANFTNANLSRAMITRVTLPNSVLPGANLSNSNFSTSNLTKADLSNSNLSGARLFETDLTQANLSNTDLSNADLQNAIAIGANFSGANLAGTNLYGVNLQPANLTDVSVDKDTRVIDQFWERNHATMTKNEKQALRSRFEDAIGLSEFLDKLAQVSPAQAAILHPIIAPANDLGITAQDVIAHKKRSEKPSNTKAKQKLPF